MKIIISIIESSLEIFKSLISDSLSMTQKIPG